MMMAGWGSPTSSRSAPAKDPSRDGQTGVDGPGDRANVYQNSPARREEGSPAFPPKKWVLWHLYLHVRATLAKPAIGTFPHPERQPSLNSRPPPCHPMRAG